MLAEAASQPQGYNEVYTFAWTNPILPFAFAVPLTFPKPPTIFLPRSVRRLALRLAVALTLALALFACALALLALALALLVLTLLAMLKRSERGAAGDTLYELAY